MSLVQTIDQIEYSESDGRPMGETDLPLQRFRQVKGEYERIEADDSGAIKSDELAMLLRLEEDDLAPNRGCRNSNEVGDASQRGAKCGKGQH